MDGLAGDVGMRPLPVMAGAVLLHQPSVSFLPATGCRVVEKIAGSFVCNRGIHNTV